MDLWRIATWVIAIALPSFSLFADNLADGHAFCRTQQEDGMPPCHLQPCPCGPGEVRLQRFEDTSGTPALCACRSASAIRQHTRQQAAAACETYRRNQHQSCFISRGDCPPGFESLAEFSDRTGGRFTACKDGRHKQPAGHAGVSRTPLRQRYQQLIDHLDSRRMGAPRSLPQATIDRLEPYYRRLSLGRLALIRTQALSKGCFNDCERIFCADTAELTAWLDPRQPLVSSDLLHLLTHAEACVRAGGREPFVDSWFRHLSDDVNRRLSDGEQVDSERLHYPMYMENHASNRGKNLCRQIPGCRVD